MKLKLLLFTFISILIFNSVHYSQKSPLNNSLQLSALAGVTLNNTDYEGLHADFAGKLALEYFFDMNSKHSLGLRFFGMYGYTKGVDETQNIPEFRTELQNYGGGLVYGYQVSENWIPYIFIGASVLDFKPQYLKIDMPNYSNNVYEKRVINYNVELGLRASLNNRISFIIALGVNYNNHDWLDDIEMNGNKDQFGTAMIGLSYALFGSTDSDGDGVSDSDDRCPDTPDGVEVDEFGCPIDSDNDGVPDYIDQCISTPPGTMVDEYGCPIDSDGDGVPDDEDQCPDTPAGVRVDAYGCPRDSDNDGVPDYLDRCPNTPANAPIDDFGCPIVINDTPPPAPTPVVPLEITSYDNSIERIAEGNIWTDGNSYVVQVSAWKTEKKANSQSQNLKNKGFDSFVVKKRFANGRTWYRVRVGYFSTIQEARDTQRSIK